MEGFFSEKARDIVEKILLKIFNDMVDKEGIVSYDDYDFFVDRGENISLAYDIYISDPGFKKLAKCINKPLLEKEVIKLVIALATNDKGSKQLKNAEIEWAKKAWSVFLEGNYLDNLTQKFFKIMEDKDVDYLDLFRDYEVKKDMVIDVISELIGDMLVPITEDYITKRLKVSDIIGNKDYLYKDLSQAVLDLNAIF